MPKLFFVSISADNLVEFVNSITVSDLALTFLLSEQFADLGANWEASAVIIIGDHGVILGFDFTRIWGFRWWNEKVAFIKGPLQSVGGQFSFEAKFQLNLPSFRQTCSNGLLHLSGVADW